MKRIIYLLFLLCVVSVSRAEMVQGLNVTMLDGSRYVVAFESKPIISLTTKKLVIKTADKELNLDTQKVKTVAYGEFDPTAIEVITSDSFLGFRIEGDVLYVNSAECNQTVTVASYTGVVYMSAKIKAGDSQNLSLSSIPQGVYLITVDGRTLKYIKR